MKSLIGFLNFLAKRRNLLQQAYVRPLPNGFIRFKSFSNMFDRSELCQKSCGFSNMRMYCTYRQQNEPLPDLMDFPVHFYPNFFKMFKNNIMSAYYIQPYIDNEFDIDLFIEASKQAVEVVSHFIARGQFSSLEGLVTPDAISEIETNFKKFSLKQALELRVKKSDIFTCFPYEIGVLADSREKTDPEVPRIRYVEFNVSYHALTGYKQLLEANEGAFNLMNLMNVPDYEKRLYALNYRFVRGYSMGAPVGGWIINGLNHVKPFSSQ